MYIYTKGALYIYSRAGQERICGTYILYILQILDVRHLALDELEYDTLALRLLLAHRLAHIHRHEVVPFPFSLEK